MITLNYKIIKNGGISMKRKILSKTILAVIVLLIFSITLPTYAATTNYARAFGTTYLIINQDLIQKLTWIHERQ